MDTETSKLFDLSGKVTVVTGGARGLGAAIARGFAGAGASVIVSDIREPETDLEPRIEYFRADVSKAADIRALITKASARSQRLDVLVANAAIPGGARAEDETEEGWEAVMAVNTKGTFLCAREAARQMRTQDGGCIINLASTLSFIGHPTALAYCASKGAIAQMTRVMAVEWSKYNIRVNAIAPGFFDTPLNTGLMAAEEQMKPIYAKIPLGRIANPKEIVGTAIYLASDASSFVTGSIVVVDGGELAAGGYTDAVLPFIYDTL